MIGSHDPTERTHLGGALPIRALAVTVIDGAERGRRVLTEDEILRVGTAEGNELVLADRTISRFHVEIRRAGAEVELRDLASTNGTRIGAVKVRDASVVLELPADIVLGSTTLHIEDGGFAMREAYGESRYGALVGSSAPMRQLFTAISKIAARDVAVLVHGESGTGKELVARAIHEASPRASGPMVVLDCGAIAPALLTSELFGHERGAFTGAERQHQGVFERAHGGTLFLDEIGELPQELQASLLGAIERGRVRRVGGRSDLEVDVRVVSATHRDLRAEVNRNAFRLDLYYRLATVTLRVPPLRERREDIRELAMHFAREHGLDEAAPAVFDDATFARLEAHGWPGNVRELRNVVEASLVLGQMPDELEPVQRAEGSQSDRIAELLEQRYRDARATLLTEFEARYLRALLERAEWNVRRAARMAGMDRSYLIDLMKKHGLS
ncbi:MAG: sigma-54-dependent Fis family transcriptional regulator [Myxococcota bacterium]|nr:sigma-54-dependent Fis family transcriptional regulator [Myxococcota bacterium]